MKTDIDNLMQAHNLDALLVTGRGQHNPPMVYLTGGGHLTNADLLKKRGEPPVLFHYAMERDEAAKTGLITKNLADYRLADLLKQANGDAAQAAVLRYQKMLTEYGVTEGRVALFGQGDAGTIYATFTALQKVMPGLTLLGEIGSTVLLEAMATKSPEEVERIRRVGQVTTQVVGKTAEFLSSHPASEGALMKADGSPLTIGEVKRRINLWLAEGGLENPEGCIFAIGRDAGVPHSSGNPGDFLRLGQTIVFDIFTCEAGGGYHYDFTRTWCLGYAPDEALKLYEDVLSVYRTIREEMKVDALCKPYQQRACALFETQGHPTIQSDPQTQVGYVHGLGHGLGLQVHERPMMGAGASETDRLVPGVVITVEPGLYYPERGLGVRLEDTVYVRPDGQIETLAEYPLDLVLPVK